MKADILVKGISELVTLAGGPYRRVKIENAGIIKNAAVVIRKSKIVWVGPHADLPEMEAKEIVDVGGRLVTPLFVDSHTHLVFAGERSWELWMKLEGKSYLEILEMGGGIRYTVRETRKAPIEVLVDEGIKRALLMRVHGTGLIEAKTGYALDLEGEVKLLESILHIKKRLNKLLEIVPTALAHVIPDEYLEKRNEYIDYYIKKILPALAAKGAEYADVFCDKGAFTVEETRIILEKARELGLKLRLHSDELANIGCSKLALEYTIHSIDHLEHLPASLASNLADTRTVATLLPTSMLSVFSEKKPPVEKLRRYGVYIGLATDYNPNNMTPSMKTVLELAVYLYKLTPLEALAAGTINAAYSLDRHGRYGKILPGYLGGLIIWDMEKLTELGYKWGFNNIYKIIY